MLLVVQCSFIFDLELLFVVEESIDDNVNLNGWASDERSIDDERLSLHKYVANVVRRSRDGHCCCWAWYDDNELDVDWAADDVPYVPNSSTGIFSSDNIVYY